MESLIKRLNGGDESATEELFTVLLERFRDTASRLLGQNPRVRRWETTDDLLQKTMLRIHRSLNSVKPEGPQKLLGLARLQFSRELTDLARKHYGPLGIGSNHETNHELEDSNDKRIERPCETHNPAKLAEWLEFHEAAEALDEPLREVFQMSWYKLMTHAEMAELLNCSTKTVQRRYRDACLALRGVVDPSGEQA